jgi:IS30 family transposase
MGDMVAHQRSTRGDRSKTAKLTFDEVIQIRTLSASISNRKIAVKFGVTRRAIDRIVSNESWRNFE